jgi:hypothetical protein
VKPRKVLAPLAALALAGALGFGLKSVLADGIPSPNPLYYSGTLTEGGTLVNGTRSITVYLWPDGTTMGTPLCQTVATTAPVTNGRFRIALATGCKAAINANPNAYVEVVDGTTSLGRNPIGAVPYAVEADHAVNATNAVSATTAATANAAAGTLATTLSTIQGQVHPASGFRAWSLTSQMIPGNETVTPITFDTVGFDTASEYSPATGVFVPKNAGVYVIFCGCEFVSPGAGYVYGAFIHDGSLEIAGAVTQSGAGTGQGITPQVSVVAGLAAGDQITCNVIQDTGAALGTFAGGQRTSFWAARLY